MTSDLPDHVQQKVHVLDLAVGDFVGFCCPGYAEVAWNFKLQLVRLGIQFFLPKRGSSASAYSQLRMHVSWAYPSQSGGERSSSSIRTYTAVCHLKWKFKLSHNQFLSIVLGADLGCEGRERLALTIRASSRSDTSHVFSK